MGRESSSFRKKFLSSSPLLLLGLGGLADPSPLLLVVDNGRQLSILCRPMLGGDDSSEHDDDVIGAVVNDDVEA